MTDLKRIPRGRWRLYSNSGNAEFVCPECGEKLGLDTVASYPTGDGTRWVCLCCFEGAQPELSEKWGVTKHLKEKGLYRKRIMDELKVKATWGVH